MPAYNVFHDAVKRGLIKEGWTITADPYFVQFGGVDQYIDMAAEKIIGAERGDQRIAVEIKSFTSPSMVTEFHSAVGQFLNDRIVLEKEDPGRLLYLACRSMPSRRSLACSLRRPRCNAMEFISSSTIPSRRLWSDG